MDTATATIAGSLIGISSFMGLLCTGEVADFLRALGLLPGIFGLIGLIAVSAAIGHLVRIAWLGIQRPGNLVRVILLIAFVFSAALLPSFVLVEPRFDHLRCGVPASSVG